MIDLSSSRSRRVDEVRFCALNELRIAPTPIAQEL
jgi:hypothetical protein